MDDQPSPFDADPARRMAALGGMRQACPVASLGPNGPHLALSHRAVTTGLRSVEDFGGSAAQSGLDDEQKTIAGILEPKHGQIRRIINHVVAFHKSQAIEPYLQDVATRLIDALVADPAASSDDGVDVMSGFVEPIPPLAMARLIGLPEAEAHQYYAWASAAGIALATAVAEGRSMSMAEAVPDFAAYIDTKIDERRALPADDWPNDALSRFLTTGVEGEILTLDAVRIQLMFMIGAGAETTRSHVGSMLYRLANDPELYQRLRVDRTLVDSIIEESLRIDAPAQFMVRDCLRPVNLEGIEVDSGEKVFLSLASANHDDDVFADPQSFDPGRSNVRDHLTFGTGPHICPGAALARLESRTALNAFLDRVANCNIGEGYEFDHAQTGMLHGPRTLMLRLKTA